VDLELLAVQQALRAAVDLPPSTYVSINVSPATLISQRLQAVLMDSNWNPHRLVIEITEHVAVSDYPPILDVIRQLRARGMRIAVDDAGSGYASLQHILAIRPDLIKLDRSLIAGIDTDPDRRALISALASFAREIGAGLVGEGIETTEELHTVRALGLRYAQGYLIGRPAALTAAEPAHHQHLTAAHA
jgi:EAL domain-containing protein (putative c-di-GMP-specific phosphodiesterase class I)